MYLLANKVEGSTTRAEDAQPHVLSEISSSVFSSSSRNRAKEEKTAGGIQNALKKGSKI